MNNQENMVQLIESRLINYHLKCSVDKWGQVGTYSLYEVFKDDRDSVKEFLKNSKLNLLSIQTYGGRFGTWEGFQIKETRLQKLCWASLEKNPNYQYAMTH